MRIDLPFGDDERSLTIPARARIDYVAPVDVPALENLSEAVANACADPVEGAALAARVGPDKTVLVIVSDLTRSPATREMLPVVLEHVAACGAVRENIRVLVARGTHRSLTKSEKALLRGGPMKGVTVLEHDCDDPKSLAALLLTKRGTPVRINRAVREADVVVLLSPISFHYFAGFGGGRKLIMPGCADRPSILANHRLSLRDTHPVTLHPSCRPGNLEGNPVHDDMVEVMRALAHVFAVNFFATVDGRVVFVNAGHPLASHGEACAAYAGRHQVVLSAPAPVVIASAGGWPHDINLLQAHKALHHAARVAADGAPLLLYARCEEGIGSESLARAIARPHDEFLDDAYDAYALNNQTAVSLIGLTRKYRVAMVTELDDETLDAAGIERCTNAEAWLAGALERSSGDRIAVIRHAAHTLPTAKE